jgi:hypothetical protein
MARTSPGHVNLLCGVYGSNPGIEKVKIKTPKCKMK